MLTLHGFELSNYYNKVKMCLLEKGVPFEEHRVMTGKAMADSMQLSPLGKVPFIVTEDGPLCESQIIMDYIERAYPAAPTLPANAYAAAKQLELVTFMELHLELVARELYGQAYFGAPPVSESTRARVQATLTKNIAAFKVLAKFAPYIGGSTFTQADMSAFVHLPVIGSATKAVYGTDLLIDAGIDWKPYVKLIGERPSAIKVNADKKGFLEAQAAAKAAK
jgi:glutathione S-transferase